MFRQTLPLSLFAAAGILAVGAEPMAAQVQREVVPFRSLGFNRSILMEGLNPVFEVSIPAPASGQLDLEQSFVQVQMEPSAVLDPASTVRFRLNGEPAAIFTVDEILASPNVRIPLRELSAEDRFITLSIEPFLYITGNHCQDIPTGNLYAIVDNASFFQLQPQVPDTTIAGFFRPTYNQINVVVPEQMDAEQTQAALWLYSVVSYEFRERTIPIVWQRGGISGQATDGGAQVILDPNLSGADITREGSILRVAPRPEVVRSLMVQLDRPALVSSGVSIQEANAFADPRNLQEISLEELGFINLTQRGIGSLNFPILFDLADLEGRPRDPAFVLRASFTPTDAERRDRFHAQIFLNDTLLQTYDLVGQTQLAETIFLPPGLLRRSNNLEMRFISIPTEGNCLSSPAEVTVQVRPDSYFTWSEYEGPTYEFNDLPHIFLGDGGQVIADGNEPALISSAAYTLGLLSRLGKRPLMPEFVAAAGVNLNSLPGSPSWRILAVPPSEGSRTFSSPIRLDGQVFEIYNPLNNQLLLQAQPTDEIGVMQYFAQNNVPTLWLSWWGDNASSVEGLGRSLADPRTLLAAQMEGNVVTSTNPIPTFTQVQSWDLRGRTLQSASTSDFNLRLLARRYRWLVILLAILLGGAAVYMLFQRLGQAPTPPPIEEEEDSSAP